ncbi:MAG: hypothetical protein ACMUEM_04955 [Flavobacteriales bacterium AspAUS03]
MDQLKNKFFRNQAQIAAQLIGLEIDHAQSNYPYNKDAKFYLDFALGVSDYTLRYAHSKICRCCQKTNRSGTCM